MTYEKEPSRDEDTCMLDWGQVEVAPSHSASPSDFRARFSSACSLKGGDSIDMLIFLTETIRPAPESLPSCPTHSILPWP